MGTVDGPGVRFVAFLQGCNLRCGCCHNPDTWEMGGGSEYTATELVARAARCKEYFGKEGGITLSGGEPLLQAEFAEAVFERFENPFIDHKLLDISLNSISKWKARVLPSLKDFYAKNKALPKFLTFSFAALLAFYTSDDLREDGLHARRADGTEYTVRDDRGVLEFFAKNSDLPAEEFVSLAACQTEFWGENLNEYQGFSEAVATYLKAIRNNVQGAVAELLR
jgi:organic radical activating enzyme